MSTSDNGPVASVPSDSTPNHLPPSQSQSIDDAPPSTPLDTLDSMQVSPAPETAQPLEPLQSQPMTATASSSSQHPPPDPLDPNGANPTTYGTRSRNRTGGRINYAEDKDLDMELEALTKPQRSSKRTSTAATETQNIPPSLPVVNPQADQPAENPPPASSTTHTPASTPAPAPSKKRKQPGSNHTASAHSTTAGSRLRNAASIPFKGYVETNMMSFLNCGRRLNSKNQLVSDDGTVVQANDHVYFVCEPPGEPYYLARIMEFLHQKNDPELPIDAMRVNWYYRPKDILRRVQDTRVVFASMHSDTCPLTSLRGKCNIQHLSDISNVDDYRCQQDSFWFDKLYDRYMHRYYEVIPVRKVVNVPQRVKTVLDQRWKFVLVEVGRGRELTSESKKCTKCEQFASNHDSVDCAVCKKTYHMQCVRPPLLKKPARGFAWACAACSRAQEMRLDYRNTPVGSEAAHGDDDDPMDEDDEDSGPKHQETRESSAAPEPHPEPTPAQIAQANLWPWRYLGVHSRAEDALDYDDRIYPRASSRLGPRHQANVNVWHGRPVELVKPAEIKRKYKHLHLKSGKPSKDTGTDTDKDQRLKRPKWVIDEPPGYIARGFDDPIEIKGKKEHTAQLTFKMPEPRSMERGGEDETSKPPEDAEKLVEDYMQRVKPIAEQYNLLDSSVDFLTKAVEKLQEHNYDVEKALQAMKGLSLRADLKQPDLNREEIKRFEEGVAKYGSELHAVSRHVGSSVKEARIVRFYYMWKKTDRGRQIWGTFEGRRSKKESKRADKDGNVPKLLDDVAHDYDDSAFDDEKASQKKRGFECKFCATRHSRQWRRAPQTAPGTLVPKDQSAKNSKDKSLWLTLALCGRCAYLWRKYAVQYEDIEEVSKKIASSGSRAAKRKVDEELLRLILEAHQMSGDPIAPRAVDEVNKAGLEVPANIIRPDEPPKKKAKADKDANVQPTPDVIPEKKKVVPEKPVEPPPIEPDPPKVKIHPCAVCHVIEVPGQRLLKCRDCRLHVHGACYGISSKANTNPWFCDMCRNDHNLQVSTTYECVLCPVQYTQQELMEPLRATHKKKTDRDREKERIEREIIQEASRRWRMEQEAAGRPVNPREALKRTAWNNWVHVTCAIWTKEMKFGNADLLDEAEGVGFIPTERFEPPCKLCKRSGLPTVKCHQTNCNSYFHVGCAHQAEYLFGFDVAPVKSSRRDAVNVMKFDNESGIVTAAIWCPNHQPISYVHNMLEPTEAGLTALQLFAHTYKQVDTSTTGTVRRAAQFTTNITNSALAQPSSGRPSLVNGITNATGPQGERVTGHSLDSSPMPESPKAIDDAMNEPRTARSSINKSGGLRKCCTCLVNVSPRWWPVQQDTTMSSRSPPMTNGVQAESPYGPSNGSHDTFMTNGIVKAEPVDGPVVSSVADDKASAQYQCHKCHVLKREPPASPSQIKRRETRSNEPVQEAFTYPAPPAFQPPPPPAPAPYSHTRPPLDLSPHPHPNGASIPPPAQPPPLPPAPHPPSWQHAPPPPPPPPHWSSAPMRPSNHQSPPVGGMYGHSSLYRPPPPPHEYNSPYGRPPHPPPPSPYGAAPLPPPQHPPAGHGPSHLAQHSPPPGPYGHPVSNHAIPPSASPSHPPRYPSPPRFGSERPPVPSPRLGLGTQNILARPPYPPEPPRQSGIGSPLNGYAMPHSSSQRVYNQAPPLPPPPPPPSVVRQPSSQSLVQIAQQAEQAGHPHSRQASVEMGNTPRFGSRAIPSPTQRPLTPASGLPARDEKRDGTGASASPSLRNLLS